MDKIKESQEARQHHMRLIERVAKLERELARAKLELGDPDLLAHAVHHPAS